MIKVFLLKFLNSFKEHCLNFSLCIWQPKLNLKLFFKHPSLTFEILSHAAIISMHVYSSLCVLLSEQFTLIKSLVKNPFKALVICSFQCVNTLFYFTKTTLCQLYCIVGCSLCLRITTQQSLAWIGAELPVCPIYENSVNSLSFVFIITILVAAQQSYLFLTCFHKSICFILYSTVLVTHLEKPMNLCCSSKSWQGHIMTSLHDSIRQGQPVTPCLSPQASVTTHHSIYVPSLSHSVICETCTSVDLCLPSSTAAGTKVDLLHPQSHGYL